MVKPCDWRAGTMRMRADGPAGAPAGAPARTPAPGRAAPLLTVAVLTLTIFHYWSRADQIASRPAGGEWTRLGGPALPPPEHFAAALVLLGLVPLLSAYLGGLRARDLGLIGGRGRVAWPWLAIGVPLAALLGRVAAGDPLMRAVYPLDRALAPTPASFLPHAALLLVYYVAWELLFRGVLLLGLRGRLGDGPANALQTGLSTLAHFARPPLETLAAVPAGLALGGITLRAHSLWPAILIHWSAGLAMDWFALAR